MKNFLKLFFGAIAFLIIFGLGRTWQVEHSPDQTMFLNGQAPIIAPQGLYRGSVPGHKVSWLGKKFDAIHQNGINLFDDGRGNQTERFPFVTVYGKGLRDKNLELLKIDYNIQENPLWLRPILDEVVQVGQNDFLGKVHLRVIPGLPFTLGYFKLTSLEK